MMTSHGMAKGSGRGMGSSYKQKNYSRKDTSMMTMFYNKNKYNKGKMMMRWPPYYHKSGSSMMMMMMLPYCNKGQRSGKGKKKPTPPPITTKTATPTFVKAVAIDEDAFIADTFIAGQTQLDGNFFLDIENDDDGRY